MRDMQTKAPESTAVRVALWRALHVEVDSPPHVLTDEIGLRLANPDGDWRLRPDMNPQFTRPFRAAIVARARFIEDLVAEHAVLGVGQYVILGAGLDTFAQRRPEVASRLRIFEVDAPGPQAWKRQRLVELGFGIPDGLRFVPVDFAMNAASLGAVALRAQNEAELRDCLSQAKAADRTVVIHVPVEIEARVPGFESWWDVPIAEVSDEPGVQKARADYLRTKGRQRFFA